MALYVLGDTHLYGGVPKPMSVFGARWTDHTEKIRTRWSALIEPSDTVVIPGDFSWAMTLAETTEDFRFLASLPGHKILSKGNHDYWWASAAKLNAHLSSLGISGISFLHNNAYLVDGIVVCGSRGWFVEEKMQAEAFDTNYTKLINRECDRLTRSLEEGEKLKNGQSMPTVVFLHFPPVFGDFICQPLVDVLKKYDVKQVYYGHIHGNYLLPHTVMYDGIGFSLASADYLNFTPLRVFV